MVKDFTSLIDEGILFHSTGLLYLIDCIVKQYAGKYVELLLVRRNLVLEDLELFFSKTWQANGSLP